MMDIRTIFLAVTLCLVSGCEKINEWQTGFGVQLSREGDHDLAVDLWQGPAEDGYPPAMANLGEAYLFGKGVEKNESEGMTLLVAAAEAGHPRSQGMAAQAYHDGLWGKDVNITQALAFARKSSDAGDVIGMTELARLYADGKGVRQNKTKAHELALMAAEKDYAFAQTLVAFNYHFGHGVDVDIPRAMSWYEKAAAQDEPFATHQLGALLSQSDSENDKARSIQLFQAAATLGFAQSMLELCRRFASGEGTKQNPDDAITWCEKAEQNNQPDASRVLGQLYADPSIPQFDETKAMAKLRQAADAGIEAAKALLATYVQTRFGIVRFGEEFLTVSGKRIGPELEGMSISLDSIHEAGSRDVLLFSIPSGGTACPVSWLLLTVSETAAEATKSFDCSEGPAVVRVEGDVVKVLLPGFGSRYANIIEQEKMRRKSSVYTLKGSTLTESKEPLPAIDGLQDLKFGMTKKQADALAIVKEGIPILGRDRRVEYRTNGKGQVEGIIVLMGEASPDLVADTLALLKQRYSLTLPPTDHQIEAYDAEFRYEERVAMAFSAMAGLSGRIEATFIRVLEWNFGLGEVTLRLGKRPIATVDENLGFEDNLIIIYRSPAMANAYLASMEKEIKNRQRNSRSSQL